MVVSSGLDFRFAEGNERGEDRRVQKNRSYNYKIEIRKPPMPLKTGFNYIISPTEFEIDSSTRYQMKKLQSKRRENNC